MLLTLLACPPAIEASVADDADRVEFVGRTVEEVLSRFESKGETFIYSSDVLSPDARFQREPPAGTDIERLKAGLLSLNVQMQPAGNAVEGPLRRWLIVPVRPNKKPLLDSISGQVLDAVGGRALADATIQCEDARVVSDRYGRFNLPRQSCAQRFRVSADNYMPLERRVPTSSERVTIQLRPIDRLEEVVVVASRYAIEHESSSFETLDASRLAGTPELGDDSIRVVNQLPGIASLGLSARPHVRGGSSDETLVVFNHVELLDPYHMKDFQSLFSSVNPSLIRSIDVYTGGFPSRYGERLSGVIDISPNSDYQESGGEVLLSLLSMGMHVHSAPVDSEYQWALAARRGTLETISGKIKDTFGEPTYSDVYGQWEWSPSDSSTLELGLLWFKDDLKVDELDEQGEGEQATSEHRNLYGWMQWVMDDSRDSSHRTTLSTAQIDQDRQGRQNDPDSDESVGFLVDRREFHLWQLAHRSTWSLSDAWNLDVGLRLQYQQGKYDYMSSVELGDLAQLLGIAEDIQRDIQLDIEGATGGVYTAVRGLLNPALFLEVGIRWDFQSLAEQVSNRQQASPRASLRYDIREDTSIRASVGRFTQSDGIHELQVTDGFTDYQPPQIANHYVLGIDHSFSDTTSLRVEAFSKQTKHRKRRFGNLFDQLSVLPELSPDRYETSPGSARTNGFEIALTYRPDENSEYWGSYSFSDSQERISGDWRPKPWDQRHTLRAGLVLELEAWSLGATIIWHSGWRTTALPEFIVLDEEGELTPLSLAINNTSLPNYFSVDARLSRTWRWSNDSLELFVELTNLTDYRNIGAIGYELEVDEETGSARLLEEEEPLTPFIPSIGFAYKFD